MCQTLLEIFKNLTDIMYLNVLIVATCVQFDFAGVQYTIHFCCLFVIYECTIDIKLATI